MIWHSTLAMTILDLAIIGLVVAMFFAAWFLGMFKSGPVPRGGRVLTMTGVALTGLFYFADLASMHLLGAFLDSQQAMTLMGVLHLEVRWIVSLVSLALLSTGIILDGYQRRRTELKLRNSREHVAAARDRIIESEIRLRSLVENSSNSVYCFEFVPPLPIAASIDEQVARSLDAVLVECNQAFAESVGADSPEQLIGTSFGDLGSNHYVRRHPHLFSEFIANGYRLVDYPLNYFLDDGDECALILSLTGVVHAGELLRIWGAERDVLQERTVKAALESRVRFETFVRQTSANLLTAADSEIERAIVACLKEVSTFIGTERAAIIWFDRDSEMIELLYFWNEEGRAPWTSFPLSRFPFTSAKFERGESIRVRNPRDIPADRARAEEFLRKVGVKSFAIVPLVAAGRTFGGLLISTTAEERGWSNQEMGDLEAIADLLANTVLRLKSHENVRRLAAELQVAKSRLEAENTYLREEIHSTHGFDELIGESDALRRCLRVVSRVAATDTPVLLQGETGTGKELIARAIHKHSDRADEALVRVNCAALPENLIESELFGHEKGAFTSADTQKPGRFELADGGTLFLDEIAELPLELQSKLLRVLQNGEFERVGGYETLKVDVRVIAATNRDLADSVEHGLFRSDLYYRIGVFPITMPPLRERGGDIALLARHFVKKHADKLGKNVTEISASMMEQLQCYDWPGNVRELEGVIQRALISSTGPVLRLPAPLGPVSVPLQPETSIAHLDLRTNEREHIRRVLEQSDWVVTGKNGAATKLGVPPSTLRSKMKKLGISRPSEGVF